MKKTMFFIIAIALAVIGVSAVSAQTKEANAMTAVTSINQLNGIWKGSVSSTQTMRLFMESQGETWTSFYQNIYGNMNVNMILDLTMNIKASTRMMTLTGKMTIVFSGGNIKTVWPDLKAAFTSDGTTTANDANYSVITTMSESDSFADNDLDNFFINKNGTKIKFSLTDIGITFFTDDFELTKQ